MAEEKKKYVVYGYKAKCSEGSMENFISTDVGHGVLYQGQPVLNANDHVKQVNLTHFGDCHSNKVYEDAKKEADEKYKAKEGDGFFTKAGKLIAKTATKASITAHEILSFDKCDLDTPLPWMFTNGDHMVDGAPALTEESQCACRFGGIISIVPLVDNNDEQSQQGSNDQNQKENEDKEEKSELEQIEEYAKNYNVDIGDADWGTLDFIKRLLPGGDEFRMEKRKKFISKYSEVISDAAKKYDIPTFLLAGVVYNEYSGKPEITDDLAFAVRSFDWSGPDWVDEMTITKNPDSTSFGNVSMQVRRAAETVGLDDEGLNNKDRDEIIENLKDPITNIFIAAKHLEDLKNIDYSGINISELSDHDIKIIATRFNRGPDMTKEQIEQNLIYGETMYANKSFIEGAMNEK